METESAAAATDMSAKPTRNPLKKLYAWVLHWAQTRYAVPALFIIAVVESSFFPIPPDVLLIAMSLGAPARAFWYATVCSVGSVLGGIGGWVIGYWFYDLVGAKIIAFFHYEKQFEHVMGLFQEYAGLAILIAAFTPIPYKVFTIAAGLNATVPLWTLIWASVVGRSARFFLVSALLYFFGPKIKVFIDKYFELLTIVFCILLVGGFLLVKVFMK
jgi:membrane protein YqaA with SNARE-associated domain